MARWRARGCRPRSLEVVKEQVLACAGHGRDTDSVPCLGCIPWTKGVPKKSIGRENFGNQGPMKNATHRWSECRRAEAGSEILEVPFTARSRARLTQMTPFGLLKIIRDCGFRQRPHICQSKANMGHGICGPAASWQWSDVGEIKRPTQAKPACVGHPASRVRKGQKTHIS